MAKKESVDLIGVDEAKRWLRRALVRERQSQSSALRQRLSRKIARHFLNSPLYKRSRSVAVFLGFGSEIQTELIVQTAWSHRKSVLIPMTSRGFDRPFFAHFQRGDRLRRTKFGPLEPMGKKAAFDFDQIDLIAVPGLAFDRRGTRLGYGGGVYDRMLAAATRAASVGLFFGFQELPYLPRAPHDHALNAVVTERGFFRFPWTG